MTPIRLWSTLVNHSRARHARDGLRPHVLRRLLCFSLFWHALDIIWVALFSLVYLVSSVS